MELGEYVTDVDAELSRRAISAMGSITMRVPSVATDMTVQIVELVDLDISYVRSEAVVNMASIVRVFPDSLMIYRNLPEFTSIPRISQNLSASRRRIFIQTSVVLLKGANHPLSTPCSAIGYVWVGLLGGVVMWLRNSAAGPPPPPFGKFAEV